MQTLQAATQTHPATQLLGRRLTQEALFQHALRFTRQQGLQQLWVTPGEAQRWLASVQVLVPLASLPMDIDDQQRLRHEVLGQWEAALARAVRRHRLAFLTQQPLLKAITQDHANFPVQILPNGRLQPGYRVEAMLAQDVVKTAIAALRKNMTGAKVSSAGWDRMVSVIREEGGEIDLKDTLANVMQMIESGTDSDALGAPLPRLHVPQHLYAPLLLAAPAAPAQTDGQLSLLEDLPLTLRISPPPLENSEARLVWDVRRRWEHLHGLPQWEGVEVVLLRNLAGVGVGLFAAEGFFPDFLLWLKRGKHQALAFLEPKGLRYQWPEDKFRLLDIEVTKWNFSVPICGFILSTTTAEDLGRVKPDCLLYQDPAGAYVDALLSQILTRLP